MCISRIATHHVLLRALSVLISHALQRTSPYNMGTKGGMIQFSLIGFPQSCALYFSGLRVSLSGHKKHSYWKLRLLNYDRIDCVHVYVCGFFFGGGLVHYVPWVVYCMFAKNGFAGHTYNESDNDMALNRYSAVSLYIDLFLSGMFCCWYCVFHVFLVHHCAHFFFDGSFVVSMQSP